MSQRSIIINDHFNPGILRVVLRRHWYKPLLVFLVLGSIAFLYLRYTKPIYSSKAVIQVVRENKTKQVLGDKITQENDFNLSKDVELLKSTVMFSSALQRLQLSTSVYNEGQLITEDLYGNTPFSIMVDQLKDSAFCGTKISLKPLANGAYKLQYEVNKKSKEVTARLNERITNETFSITIRSNKPADFNRLIASGTIYFVFNDRKGLVKKLYPGLSILPIDEKANTIEVSYKHENRYLAYNLVNALIESYFNFEKFRKQKESKQTIAFIDGQLDSLSLLLDQSKKDLTAFQKEKKLPIPEFEESTITTNITDFSKRIGELEEEISSVDYVSKKINGDINRPELYRILPELVGKKSYEGAIRIQIEELTRNLEKQEELLQDYTYENQKVRRAREKVAASIAGINKSLNTVSERLNHEKRLLDEEFKKYEEKLLGLPEKKTEFNRLKYIEDLNRSYFNLFTEKKIESQLSNAGYSSDNRLLSIPELNSVPDSPNKTRTYLSLSILTFILSIIVLVFYYLTYNEIQTATDLKQILPDTTSILGTIPFYKKRRMKHSQIVVTDSPKSRLTESVRNIKSNVIFINKDARTIAVTSTISGEGKTFVILNLASVYALSGKRCIIIDLDLRKPKVHLG
ncbi:MAG: GumC family protein, partial [Crocinitomicaceae bacterium]